MQETEDGERSEMKRAIVATVMLVASAGQAQFSREWQSPNLGYGAWGASYGYDVSGDGIPNMYARGGSQLVIYDRNYSPYWTFNFSGYEYVSLVSPRDVDGDGLVRPVNMDGDPAGEVVLTSYRLSGSDYFGRIYVYDAVSKQLEWQSDELSGFYGSASVDDVDGDGKHEVIITRMNYTGNWGYVEVYGHSGAGADERFGLKKSAEFFGPTVGPEPAVGFVLGSSARVRLVVRDAAGRQVRELAYGLLPAGDHRMVWDGRDDSGGTAPAGTYVYQLEREGGVVSGRIVLAR